MARFKLTFVFIAAISFCLCEIDIRKKAKLINGFVEFYNRLPDEIYICDEGFLQSAQRTVSTNVFCLYPFNNNIKRTQCISQLLITYNFLKVIKSIDLWNLSCSLSTCEPSFV